MLKIEGLYKAFDSQQVLNGIDLTVEKGEVIAILGPSGSGKTTLLRCVSFLTEADAGKVTLGDYSLDLKGAHRREIMEYRRNMGFVFQGFYLFRNMTALQNVMEGLVTVRKMDRKEAEARAMEVLEKVGMADMYYKYPDELSGGQQQRVAIARAIAPKPEVILFDEPTSALDPELTGEVLEVMTRMASTGVTMIVVTHEMEFAREVASKVIFMEDGVIVEQGSSHEMFTNPVQERTRQFLGKYMKS